MNWLFLITSGNTLSVFKSEGEGQKRARESQLVYELLRKRSSLLLLLHSSGMELPQYTVAVFEIFCP